MRRQCRIWWPKQLSSSESSSYSFLFGWFVSCASTSLDIIVAFACDEVSLSRCQCSLKQEILRDTNGSMSVFLQDKSMFSLLGQCAAYPSRNDQLLRVDMVNDNQSKSSNDGAVSQLNRKVRSREKNNGCECGCNKLDGLLEKHRLAAVRSSQWIHMVYDSHEIHGRNIHWIPKLHHMHWNGKILSQCDVHVIFYEAPRYGSHHFSMSFWNSSKRVKALLKKPKWVYELHQKQPLNDLEAVVLAMNSATASKMVFEKHVGSKGSFAKFSIICMFIALVWQLLAVSVASLSTMFYIFLQFLHSLLKFASETWINMASARVFNFAFINFQIRCGQILYWPIFLQDKDLRSQSCVEHAEKAALHRHSMWSSLAVDVLLGNLIGLALLFHAEAVCSHILNFANDMTNELLRSGCVWLMGVPAGFKLNTELAGVLGMISLNAIQIWSTLWFFVDYLFIYLVKGIAVLGILFGMTIPAAFVRDMIVLVTLHVSTLHWMISVLYSQQIQALAALWRLFRGRKWNPLRQRLDSYDYTVKQHIVGSLLFTPLLLLLPTTSVFYIFFTMMNSSISLICMLIEVTVSVIHATPYINIVLWLMRRRRFPSGIWFEIVTCHSNSILFPEVSCLDKISLPKNSQLKESISGNVLISVLHSNFWSIGQIVLPHYRKVFSGVSRSYFAKSAYGVLTGKRMAYTLGTKLPSTMPWMFIPCKEYWCLCRNSILACMPECDCYRCR
ncbi:phosphatidylinositol N-acetylglucosaminyltransferase subunit GPI1 isoform X1 [Pistacia vera]|uniref:phosphatidylinositol N-acetylglucosaminyltransferase subunit GPI1 isoform X1 n=1 Tax=Pistacia vera TaxID=55513 RepID=UPI001262D712|nr:phosphatidylinositol N-acetylglucosaminyltransferase subunit GPI1 isoform X1 [Pistacia vera]